MSTASSVIERLQTHGFKKQGNDWRGNSPFRPGSDSNGFAVTIDDDEHGAYIDHVTQESGTLYDLAEKLGIEPTPQTNGNGRVPVENTKRAYRDLAEYAQVHGVSESVFTAAGWQNTTYIKRPAIQYKTANGIRYRFLDGQDPPYINEKGYTTCWYGLERAATNANNRSVPIVLCNGEASTVVANHFGIHAFAMTGGEKGIPENLLTELNNRWQGDIWIALDCDTTGRAAAEKIKTQIPRAIVLDLGLGEHGDLADYCKLYTSKAGEKLAELAYKLAMPDYKAVTMTQTIDNYIARLDQKHVITGEPIVMPYRSFHTFGGYACAIMPRKIVGVLAPSGHGKTTFLESTVDPWLKWGLGGMWYGPEFSPDEYMDRRIQRNGGISYNDMVMWELWKKEEEYGIPEDQRKGTKLTADAIIKGKLVAESVRQWPGNLVFFESLRGMYFEQVLDNMQDNLRRRRANGERVVFAIFDYAQLLKVRGTSDTGSNRHEDALELIKAWTEDNDIVSIVGSQVRKDETRANRDNKIIGADGGLYITEHKFNLFLTINVVYEKDPMIPDEMIATNQAWVNIAKNTPGRKGKVRMIADFENLRFKEYAGPQR